jgi:hypothetical protein
MTWKGSAMPSVILRRLLPALGLCWCLQQPLPVSGADTQGGLSNWFETVAEAERLAEQQAQQLQQPEQKPQQKPQQPPAENPGPRPVVAPQPAANVARLRGLIADRNRLIDKTKLLASLETLARNKRLDREESKKLPGDFQRYLELYFQMRVFVPTLRGDPNLPAVVGVLQEAIRARKDFGEGRVLAAACLLYDGEPVSAKQQLDEASKFLTEHRLNVSPPGQDCCYCWLALQRPQAVKGYVDILENPKVFPLRILTPYQAMLVGDYGWQTGQFNGAGRFFPLVFSKANAAKNPPPVPVARMIAKAALFFLAAGNAAARDSERAKKFLETIPAGLDAWEVRRARAALQAWQADQAAANGDQQKAAGLWQAAVQEIEACRRESLPTLDAEIDQQIEAYRNRQVWYKQRPAAAVPAAAVPEAAQ